MRVLLIHASRFSYRVTEKTSAVSSLAKLDEAQKSGSVGDALVAYVASEKLDGRDIESVARQAADTIAEQARLVGTDTVVLYPYAHLSSDLSSPRVATAALDRIGELMSGEENLKLKRAPFGFYKAFEIECKGHPLSEIAKTILPERGASDDTGSDQSAAAAAAERSEALGAEEALKSEWRVIDPDGGDLSADDFDFQSAPTFREMYDYELSGSRLSTEPPAHIDLMRRMELVDYEPGSDAGNFRWYPNGQLVKALAEDFVNDLLARFGAMRVETPVMYDFLHPSLMSYLNRFPARQYIVVSDKKEYFLRFAACFGQYLMQHDMQISHRQLPARFYELTHYSFRREQTGELAGLRRLRTFTMPDLHALTKDSASAREEFLRQTDLAIECMKGFDLEYEVALRFVRGFLEEDPGFAQEIVRRCGRPALVELWDERFFYFVAKLEFNFIDAQSKSSCLSTVQIDVENTERFEITYVDEDGGRKHPVLLHSSTSGSIERVVCALLEQEARKMKEKKTPTLPLWLSPIQVRVVPVAERHHAFCESLLEALPFRVDFDDRDMTVGKKIREAEKRWIPFILVVGDREVDGGQLAVRMHGGSQESRSPDELRTMILERTAGKPFRRLNVPARLSERPIFVG